MTSKVCKMSFMAGMLQKGFQFFPFSITLFNSHIGLPWIGLFSFLSLLSKNSKYSKQNFMKLLFAHI